MARVSVSLTSRLLKAAHLALINAKLETVIEKRFQPLFESYAARLREAEDSAEEYEALQEEISEAMEKVRLEVYGNHRPTFELYMTDRRGFFETLDTGRVALRRLATRERVW